MITAVGTIIGKLFTPKFIIKNKFLNNLFIVTPVWFVIRILAAVFIFMAHYEVGFEAIFSLNTGGLVLYDLLPILFSVFFSKESCHWAKINPPNPKIMEARAALIISFFILTPE